MSSGLGRALAEGFTGYLAGRQQREERDYQRQQEAARIQREQERTQFAQWLQQRQMGLAERGAQRADDAAAIEMDQAGYAPYQPDAYQGAVESLAPQMAGPMGQFGPMVAFLADRQARQQVQPGRPMKTHQSVAERDAERKRSQQVTDVADARAYDTQRDERNFSQQRQLAQEGRAFTAAENAKNRAVTLAGMEARGSGGSARPLTEGERRTGAMLAVAEPGLANLERILTTTGPDGKPVRKRAPSLTDRGLSAVGMGVGNVLTGDEYRQMQQAAMQLADMWLRFTSGAAVTENEVERFATTFTPLPGDDDQTLAQKEEARRTMIGALRTGAGRGAQPAASTGRPPLQDFFR